MFGQRQFRDQSKSASQANELSYAMTVLSSDLRKLKANDVRIKERTSNTPVSEILVNGTIFYSGEDNKLKKENIVLIDEVIVSFENTENKDGVHIELKNIQKNGLQKNYETTIYFRR